MTLVPFGDGGFACVDLERGLNRLAYWCFVNIRKNSGVITIKAYHPAGPELASAVLSNVLRLISICGHIVNQVLLLERLHQSRMASSLLIPPESNPSDVDRSVRFQAGAFQCPVVFQTDFELFHRCATSPSQVARSLEASVMHIFGISNRRHYFVYKDESGSIFYMELIAAGGGAESDGTIGLLVYGVDEPGPSVTLQLTALLQKRLLLIAVDMLSSVLIKNVQYNWRSADLLFVRSFEKKYERVDQHTNDQEPTLSNPSDRIYAFPDYVFDPGMILLYFRQNLCGSTYFHMLNSSDWGQTVQPEAKSLEDAVRLDALNFVFFFNNTPTKLDPKFQGVATLTEKGIIFARQTGSGIAIIELELLDQEGKPMSEIHLSSNALQINPFMASEAAMQYREISASPPECGAHPKFSVRVKISATALKKQSIHDWIYLSLRQSLIAWTIERHLELVQRQLLLPSTSACALTGMSQREIARNMATDTISPGLSFLSSALKMAQCLPHPAVLKWEQQGVVRSSAVAFVTMELLERCLLDQLLIESRGRNPKSFINTLMSKVCVIRLSRNEQPLRVRLQWDAEERRVVVSEMAEQAEPKKAIRDAPIDCPEYLCSFFTPEYVDDEEAIPLPKLFEEVAIPDGTENDFRQSLVALKSNHSRAFRRSFGFIFSVKRNRRMLLAYNWSPQSFRNASSRLLEKDKAFLESTEQSVDSLQRRSLKYLSPKSAPMLTTPSDFKTDNSIVTKPGTASRRGSSSGDIGAAAEKADNAEQGCKPEQKMQPEPSRRATRPSAIRRPKLIGKSVEGAALHAVAASRARASSNMFKGGLTNASSSVQRKPQDSSERQVTKRKPDIPKAPTASSSITDEERDLNRVREECEAFINQGKALCRSSHSLQIQAVRSLAGKQWPVEPPKTVSQLIAEFVIANNSLAWSDVCEVPQLPRWMESSFLASFARTITAWTTGISVVPVSKRRDGMRSPSSSILLTGEVRNVRDCKCLTVLSLTSFTTNKNGARKMFLRCNGWAVALPRRLDARQDFRHSNLSLAEKDATGIDILSTRLRGIAPVESLLFDFIASTIESATRSRIEHGDVLTVVEGLMEKYEMKQQMIVLRSNYKVFSPKIVLASYRDRLIDSYSSSELFTWLRSNAAERGLTQCSPRGICLKREIDFRGTRSVCFLKLDETDAGKMHLVILCRTQGKNLYEFVNREGSIMCLSMLDNIAIEAARLAYHELKAAASSLQLDFLWKRLSTLPSPSGHTVTELLELAVVKPITKLAASCLEGQHLATILETEMMTDWRAFMLKMELEPCFAPFSKLRRYSGETALFYLKQEDVFLLTETDAKGHKISADLVVRTESEAAEKTTKVIQKITNYILHYLWSDALSI